MDTSDALHDALVGNTGIRFLLVNQEYKSSGTHHTTYTPVTENAPNKLASIRSSEAKEHFHPKPYTAKFTKPQRTTSGGAKE